MSDENIAQLRQAPYVGFDIDNFADIASADFEVRDPRTNAPTGIIIQIAGPEHPARKKMDHARQRKMRKELARTGKLQLADPAEDEEDQVEYLATCILGWNRMTKGGRDIPYTAQAARDLMADPKRRWLRDQIKAGVEERETFIEGSGQS
ncbi:MAG: hypothetical protein IPN63_07485 [Gammaproteobacteria bacterium]|nr:hypothetical protein [Gammaproteobacteria bacterium]